MKDLMAFNTTLQTESPHKSFDEFLKGRLLVEAKRILDENPHLEHFFVRGRNFYFMHKNGTRIDCQDAVTSPISDLIDFGWCQNVNLSLEQTE